MKVRNIEDRLAVLAALVVLVGVTFAAGDALAATDASAPTLDIRLDGRTSEQDASRDAVR